MDSSLVVRAQQGDRGAFTDLVDAIGGRLHAIAFSVLRDRELARDATQQALLDIWRYIRRLRGPSSFNGWSYRLLVHACYAEARRKPDWADASAIGPSDVPAAPDEYDSIIDREA